jgi:hypothetical protein
MNMYTYLNFVTLEKGCKKCPKGKWSSALSLTANPNQVPCTFCDAGRYNDQLGGSSLSACEECPKGTFSTQSGQEDSSSCLVCGKGRWSNTMGETNPNCKKCPEGSFNDDDAAAAAEHDAVTDCKPCPKDTYNRFQGATNEADACQACPPGTFTAANENPHTELDFAKHDDQSKCTACSAGEVYVSGKCEICEPGKFAGLGQATCEFCAAGMFSNVENAIACKPCQPGYFRDGGSDMPANPGQECKKCPVGRFMDVEQGTVCKGCPSGRRGKADAASFTTTDAACVACSPGKVTSQD